MTDYLLARRNRPEIIRFANGDPLIALDFDGTLAPIVADRSRAQMVPRTRELLGQLTTAFTCAVISGRARSDIATRVANTGLVEVIGNHGMEPSEGEARFEQEAQSWLRALEPELLHLHGVEIENKRFSISIHFRNAADHRIAHESALAAAARLGPNVRVVQGKSVVNLVPVGAPTKWDALLSLQRRTGKNLSIYAGDDDTDEDVFAAASPETTLTVRVGRSEASRATYYLRSQAEVDVLMELLLIARRSTPGRGPAQHSESLA